MSNAIQTTGEAMPAINRRKALFMTGGAAVAAIAGSAMSAEAAQGGIAEAIEAHKLADKTFVAAMEREEETEDEYFASAPKERIVPLSTGGGVSFHVRFDLERYADECRKEIERTYDGLFAKLKTLRLPADLDGSAAKSLKAKLRTDLGTLRKMHKAEQANRDAHGFGPATAERDRASDAERDAFRAVCACPCTTAGEYHLKGLYLQKVLSGTVLDDMDQRALFASMTIGGGLA